MSAVKTMVATVRTVSRAKGFVPKKAPLTLVSGCCQPFSFGRCKHRNTGASTGIDRNTGESRRNAPEYTVCVNGYDVCVCSVWLYFVFNVSRTN